MIRTSVLLLAGLCASLVAQPGISREIVKEPAYVGAPLYALFAFGEAPKTRLWAVLDRSEKKLSYHDVLYFDVDGDGDLTDANERFTGKYRPERHDAGMGMQITVPRFSQPGSDTAHTKLRVHPIPKTGRTGVYWTLLWRGKVRLSGGYGPVGTNTTSWGKTSRTAPVFRPTPDGPLSFGLYAWGEDEWKLKIGGKDKVYVMVGPKGPGPDTLAVFDEDHLDLTKEKLVATLIARTKDGRDIVLPVRIRNHC